MAAVTKWAIAAVVAGASLGAIAAGAAPRRLDADLADVSVARLQAFYRTRRYSVAEIVRWHLDRIHRYDGTYRAVQTVLDREAMAGAVREDADARRPGFRPGLLWGVPIVVKANTSVRGQITTAGWHGFMRPGHELLAPRDATLVARLRAAGAIIVGITNMPDFAASDTMRSTAFGRTGNAYDVRFSPGGSSGGTATAVTAGMAVLGTGSDTADSIRLPAAASNLVGLLPTRGLVSTSEIAPLDALLDNAGPIARTVADAAVALDVMAGEDPLDPTTAGSAARGPSASFASRLRAGALKGRRFGVPAFILDGAPLVMQGLCPGTPPEIATKIQRAAGVALKPTTRAAFLRAVEELRAAGATIVIDPTILPDGFADLSNRVCTLPYLREGYERFLGRYGPPAYRSVDAYARTVGHPLPSLVIGGSGNALLGQPNVAQRRLEEDHDADRTYLGPRRAMLAAYLGELDRLHLDGFVYPAIQMPPVDETMPQNRQVSSGPHTATGWSNVIGVPAIAVPAGFYADGLPFGIEFSARPWHDGDMLAWAYDYENSTHHRRSPTLIERGTLATATHPLEVEGDP